MFLSGILFSALTVFAATVTVNTDITQDAVQYLQNLILTDNSGTTWIVLNGTEKKIMSNIICDTNWDNCKSISELITGVELNDYLTWSALDGYLSGTDSFLTWTDGKWCIMSGSQIECFENEPTWSTSVEGLSWDYYPLSWNSISNPIEWDLFMWDSTGSYNIEVWTIPLNFGAMIDVFWPIITPNAYVPWLWAFQALITKGTNFFLWASWENNNIYLGNSDWTFTTQFWQRYDKPKFSISITSWAINSPVASWVFDSDWTLQAGDDISPYIADDGDFITKKYFDDNWDRAIEYDWTETWDNFYNNNNLDTIPTIVLLSNDLEIYDEYDVSNIRFVGVWWNKQMYLGEAANLIWWTIYLDNIDVVNQSENSIITNWRVYMYWDSAFEGCINFPIISLDGENQVSVYLNDSSTIGNSTVEILDSLARLDIIALWEDILVREDMINTMIAWTIDLYYNKDAVYNNWITRINPDAWWDINYINLTNKVSEYSTDTTLNDWDRQVLADTTAWDVQLILPPLEIWAGDYISIHHKNWTNSLTVKWEIWDSINGSASYSMDSIYDSSTFFSDPDSWDIYVVSDYSNDYITTETDPIFMANSGDYIPRTAVDTGWNNIWSDVIIPSEKTVWGLVSWLTTNYIPYWSWNRFYNTPISVTWTDIKLNSWSNQIFTNPTTTGLDFRFAWSGGLMEAQYFTGWAWTTASIFTL